MKFQSTIENLHENLFHNYDRDVMFKPFKLPTYYEFVN